MSRTGWVMYNGTVAHLPLEEQFRAAALAGCTSLTTGVSQYFERVDRGLSAKDQKAMAADHGVAFDHLDPFVRWLPNWEPVGTEREILIEAFGFDEDIFFRVADELEARSVTVVSLFPAGATEMSEMVDCFGRFCGRAAERDIRCDLEFVPFWGIGDLDTAWNIVRQAGAPNSGILIDFWHYTRGNPDDQLLRSIPGHKITGVQMDDGAAELPKGSTLWEDTQNRLFPGDGEFKVRELVALLREIGGLNNVGPEIFNPTLSELSADEVAERVKLSMDWALCP